MTQFGDEIEVSLEEVSSRIRALSFTRVGLPDAGEVAGTSGPGGAASADFKRALADAARVLSRATSSIGEELQALEQDMAANATALVEADGEIAADVRVLEGYIGAASESVTSTPTTGAATGVATGTTAGDDAIGIG